MEQWPGDSPYEQHRDFVLAALKRHCRWLDATDREDVFHDAYAAMLEKQRRGELDVKGMDAHQGRPYLVQTAIHMGVSTRTRAPSESRRSRWPIRRLWKSIWARG